MINQDLMMPERAEKYGQSPVFTALTVPKKLLAAHDLKLGTWGRMSVTSGEVRYFLAGDESPTAILQAGKTHVIAPARPHYISVSDDAVFQIEFWREV